MTQKYISLSLEIIILQKRNVKARENRITVRSCNQLFLPLVLELRSPTSDFGPPFPTILLRALMGTGLNGYLHKDSSTHALTMTRLVFLKCKYHSIILSLTASLAILCPQVQIQSPLQVYSTPLSESH